MISRIHIGADVSCRWFDVCAGLEPACELKRLDNEALGIAQFVNWAKPKAKKVFVCMEHTGGYETALATACVQAGFTVSIVDGAMLKDYRRSHGAARAKTDKRDAILLAKYSQERRPPMWLPMSQEYLQLRELIRHRECLMAAKHEWASRSSHSSHCELVSAQRKAIVQILGLQCQKTLQEALEHIQAHPNLRSGLERLITIPGIAKLSAAKILAEAGPISNYKSPGDLALAAGLCPTPEQSGTRTGPAKLRVYGSKELRCALYLPTLVCRRHDRGINEFMKRLAQTKAKSKKTVITAGMRKLAHVVWAVLTKNEDYNTEKL